MSAFALALVVAAAFIHATWNLLAKRAAGGGAAFVFAYTLVACVLYIPWVGWELARGAMVWSWPAVGFLTLSASLHLVYSLSLQRGYQVGDLSVVYPVARGTGPMLSSLGAFLLLGEHPTPLKLAGLGAVVGGIVLIATQGRLANLSTPSGRAGLRWGLTTGALIAAYSLSDAYSVKTLGVPPVVLDWFSSAGRALMLAPAFIGRRDKLMRPMAGKWRLALWVGALSPLSYILVLTALDGGAPLSVVAPMREMSMMIGALMGMILLREDVGRWRLAGCAVLVMGVVLLQRG